jgi:CHAD domain-containing protein
VTVDGSTPASIAAHCLVAERCADFSRRYSAAVRSFRMDEIHDLRVSSRRLREALLLFSPRLPFPDPAVVERKVKRVTKLLGPVLAADEAATFFSRVAGRFQGLERDELRRLAEDVARSRKNVERKALRKLEKVEAHRAVADFAGSIGTATQIERRIPDPLDAFAWSALAARHAEVVDLVHEATRRGAGDARHRLRIRIKHFRYRVEILGFLFGTGCAGIHRSLKNYQDVLGEMHDLDDFACMAGKSALSGETEAKLLDVMSRRESRLFGDFMHLLETIPPEKIGERIKRLL